MSQYDELQNELAQAPLLHIDCDRGIVRLISRAEGMRIVSDATESALAYVCDLEWSLVRYARIVGTNDREFIIDEIATISGITEATVHHYDSESIITPSVRPSDGPGRGKTRLYSWRDGYLAGVIGSLRRQRIPIPMLRRVARLLRESTPQPLPTDNDQVEA